MTRGARLRRTLVAAVAVSLASASPALAEPGDAHPVQHLTFALDEDVATHVEAIGPGCPSFVGVLVEHRHDDLAGVMLADGTVHGRTTATARVELVPDDRTATSYAGAYTAHQTGTYRDGGAQDSVVTSVTHGTITGSDGSTYRVHELVHTTVHRDGTWQVWFDRMRCD